MILKKKKLILKIKKLNFSDYNYMNLLIFNINLYVK